MGGGEEGVAGGEEAEVDGGSHRIMNSKSENFKQ